jgi:hypothetical protein
MNKCNTCHHNPTCANRNKHGGIKESYPPLTQRKPKPYCWECGHVWVKHNDFKYRECDVCHAVKPLNDESVQIKHTRG